MLVQAHARRIVEVVNCVDAINCDQNTYTWLQLDLVGKGYNEAMCRYWPLGFDTQGTERSLPGVALHSGPTKTSGPSLHPSWVHEKAAASSKWRWVCCCRGATSSEVKSSCQPMPCYLANRSTFLYCNQFNSIHMSGSINKRVDAWKKMPNMLPHNTCSWKHWKTLQPLIQFYETRPTRPASLHHFTEDLLSEPTGFHRLRNTRKHVRHTWGKLRKLVWFLLFPCIQVQHTSPEYPEWSKCGFGLHRGDATSAGRMARQTGVRP